LSISFAVWSSANKILPQQLRPQHECCDAASTWSTSPMAILPVVTAFE
jgi:hypothetical protein